MPTFGNPDGSENMTPGQAREFTSRSIFQNLMLKDNAKDEDISRFYKYLFYNSRHCPPGHCLTKDRSFNLKAKFTNDYGNQDTFGDWVEYQIIFHKRYRHMFRNIKNVRLQRTGIRDEILSSEQTKGAGDSGNIATAAFYNIWSLHEAIDLYRRVDSRVESKRKPDKQRPFSGRYSNNSLKIKKKIEYVSIGNDNKEKKESHPSELYRLTKEYIKVAYNIDQRFQELLSIRDNGDPESEEFKIASNTIEKMQDSYESAIKGYKAQVTTDREVLYDGEKLGHLNNSAKQGPAFIITTPTISSAAMAVYNTFKSSSGGMHTTMEQMMMPNFCKEANRAELFQREEEEEKKADAVAPTAPATKTTKESNYMTKNDIKKLIKEAFEEVNSIYGSYRSSRHHLQEPSEDVLDDKQKNLSQWKHFCDTMSNDTTKMQAVQFCKILIKDTELLQDILEIIAQKPELAVIIMNKMLENDGPLQ